MYDTSELALKFLEGLGGTRALTVAIMVRHCAWDAIATLRCDPRDYLSAESYARDQAATALLRKHEPLPTSFDRIAAARANWEKGERDCYRTNERLARYLDRWGFPAFIDREQHVEEFFLGVRQKIVSWIGQRPKSLTDFRFGPGGTYTDRGKRTTIPHKMSANPSLTKDAIWYLPQFLGSAWGHACASQSLDPVFVRGNRFAFAPKDATKFRAIASEPSVNITFQLGLGTELRSALRRAGIDLDNGQFIHRQVACEASVTRRMATLDLSNASDSVCTNLVRLCMPPLWFEALNDLRSPFTQVDDKWFRLEKFSSMGNGYTFELETLLFAAICCVALEQSFKVPSSPKGHARYQAVLGQDVYVYGDDIIVPTDGARDVIAALRFCGFELNREKSFYMDEPFRESCGGDYFAGQPVRPFYLKDELGTPEQIIAAANGVRALSDNLSIPNGFDVVRGAWFHLLDRLPERIRRCRGPKDLGDIVIHDSERFWQVKWRSSIRLLMTYMPAKHRKVLYEQFHPDVVLACATYGCGWGGGGVTPRDSVLGYKLKWVPFS